MSTLPNLGAALRLDRLDEFKTWILERDRDVELQDPCLDFPIGQWSAKAAHWNEQMSGYGGRVGVHGPYDGIALASRDRDARELAQRKLLDCLAFCEAISATHCVIHCPFHFLGSSAACHTPTFALDTLIDNTRATLEPALERAAQIGCCLVVVYQTEPLNQDTEIVGPIKIVLHVSSDSVDTDFTAKLIDVYPPSADFPNGFEMNLTDGILRTRYRETAERAVFMKPGKVYELTIDPFPTANVFKKGHRIRLDISSSNFPRFDVNPNTGEPLGLNRQTKIANNTIHHATATPSYVLLPLQPK